MTRQMAIKWLKRIKGMLIEDSEENKAVDIAIASLETDEAYQLEYENPTFCADCISRAEAIDAIAEVVPVATSPDCTNPKDHDIIVSSLAYVKAMEIIKGLKSVYPKEK